MILKSTLLLIYTLLFLFTGYTQVQQTESVIIEGKVVDGTTGKPVTNVHVYIIDGEEETMTNSQGEFRIRSWQKTPLRLTVAKYGSYQKESILVTDPSRKQLIRLKN
jgi:CarboxypepD_reg-like domain